MDIRRVSGMQAMGFERFEHQKSDGDARVEGAALRALAQRMDAISSLSSREISVEDSRSFPPIPGRLDR